MNQANLYINANALQKSDAGFVLENYARLIKWKKNDEDTILDVGCGTGDVTMEILHTYLPQKFGKLIGVDLSESMIEYARTKYIKRRHTEFLQLDITTKEIPVDFEEAFDHVFSFYCLHWVQDQERALTNMYTMLKPGGDMLLTFLSHHPLFDIYEKQSKNNKWAKYMQNIKNFISPLHHLEDAEKEYGELLRKIGFNVHLCKVTERKYVYGNLDILRKAMLAVNPFIKAIPEDLRSGYIEDYIEEVRKLDIIERNHNNNEEKVHCIYKLIIVFCSKS